MAAGSSSGAASAAGTTRAAARPVRVTHEQAVRDARTLVRMLERSHPDPYAAFGGKVAFKRRVHELIRDLPADGMQTERARGALAGALGAHWRWSYVHRRAPVIASLHAGEHTGTLFGDHSRTPRLGHERCRARWHARLSAPRRARPKRCGAGRRRTAADSDRERLSRVPVARPVAHERRALAAASARLRAGGALTLELEAPGKRRVTRTLPAAERPPMAQGASLAAWRSPPKAWAEVPPSDDPFTFRFLAKDKVAYFKVATVMGREAFEFALRYGWGEPRRCSSTTTLVEAQSCRRRRGCAPRHPVVRRKGRGAAARDAQARHRDAGGGSAWQRRRRDAVGGAVPLRDVWRGRFGDRFAAR